MPTSNHRQRKSAMPTRMPAPTPVTNPRTVLFFPNHAAWMGRENRRIKGMFFATTGTALATNAGRKIKKIWRKLAKDIVRDEKHYNGDEDIREDRYRLC